MEQLVKKFSEFKLSFKENPEKANNILDSLKKDFLNLESFLPGSDLDEVSDLQRKEIIIVRKFLINHF
jgi:hypothetical protein